MPSQPLRAHTAVTRGESRHVSPSAASPYGAISEQVAQGFIQGMSSASGLARFLGFVMVPYTFLPERIAGQWECFCARAQAPQAAVGSCWVESCKCGPRPCCASLGCRNSCCCSFNSPKQHCSCCFHVFGKVLARTAASVWVCCPFPALLGFPVTGMPDRVPGWLHPSCISRSAFTRL